MYVLVCLHGVTLFFFFLFVCFVCLCCVCSDCLTEGASFTGKDLQHHQACINRLLQGGYERENVSMGSFPLPPFHTHTNSHSRSFPLPLPPPSFSCGQQHYKFVVFHVEKAIAKARSNMKLPLLYVIDSIINNSRAKVPFNRFAWCFDGACGGVLLLLFSRTNRRVSHTRVRVCSPFFVLFGLGTQHGEGEFYAPRFKNYLQTTFKHLFKCSKTDQVWEHNALGLAHNLLFYSTCTKACQTTPSMLPPLCICLPLDSNKS